MGDGDGRVPLYRDTNTSSVHHGADQKDDEEYTRNLATMEAQTRKVVGVKVCEVIEGVDVDKMKKLKYGLPNVNEYDIGDYLDFDELQIIAGDFGDTDYDNFTDEQKERYNKFGKAFEDKIAADYPDVIPPYPGNE